jgi:hypothetical protein
MNRFRLPVIAFSAVALLAAAPLSAKDKDKDSPGPDKAFLGIDDCKKDKFDCAFVAPGFSFAGKTIHVQKFEKVADPPKGDDYGELHWKNAGEFMQRVFEEEVNDHMKSGTKFVTGGSGEYTLKGQVTEFRYPKKGASWGGWIGEAVGSGTIVYDWKIVDKSGKTVVGVHHKTLANASNTLDNRVNNFYNDDMIDFVKEHSK